MAFKPPKRSANIYKPHDKRRTIISHQPKGVRRPRAASWGASRGKSAAFRQLHDSAAARPRFSKSAEEPGAAADSYRARRTSHTRGWYAAVRRGEYFPQT